METIPDDRKREILYQILELTQHQQQVLQTLWTKVPDPAKGAIQRAIEVSRKGHEQAESALKKGRIITPPKPKIPKVPKVPGKSISPQDQGTSTNKIRGNKE